MRRPGTLAVSLLVFWIHERLPTFAGESSVRSRTLVFLDRGNLDALTSTLEVDIASGEVACHGVEDLHNIMSHNHFAKTRETV